jgi:hypothetical protein
MGRGVVGSTLPPVSVGTRENCYLTSMDITPVEEPVVRRAVEAYQLAKKGQKGPFRSRTADEILEELRPSPVRWVELAALVIETAEGPSRRNR